DRESASGDVGGGAGGGVEGVVTGVGSGDGDAADRHTLAVGDVLVAEAGAGVAVGEQVTGDAVVGQVDRRVGVAVVDLGGGAGGADRESASGDVGRGAGGGVERVVAGVSSGDGDAADRHTLAVGDVLVAEAGAGVAVGEQVTADAVVGQVDRRVGVAVVNLVV